MASLATARRTEKHLPGDASVPNNKSQQPNSDANGTNPRQKTTLFLREAEKNRRLIEKFETEKKLSLLCRKNGWSDICREIELYENELEGERDVHKIKLHKQLVKIHYAVKKFQRQLTDVKPTPELIEKLQGIMLEVEISINTLKEEQRSSFERLLKEERMCGQEVTAYEQKIENWSLPPKSVPRPHTASMITTKPPQRDLPVEVLDLDSFLQKTGGFHGGWDQYDHQAFLKVWTKHGGKLSYRKEVKACLPGKALEEIMEHEDWYRELIHLQDRKRKVIQRWKLGRDRERQSRIQEEAEDTERKVKEAKSQTKQVSFRTEEEKQETARRLEEWKEEKRRKEEKEKGKRLLAEIRKMKREKEERRRQLEVKLTVEEHQRQKKEEEEEQERRWREEEQREKDEKRRVATKGIKRFNERDFHKLGKQKLQEKQVKEQEEERQSRIVAKFKEKMDSQVSKDPSRVTRPTKGWEERMKHIGPSGGGPQLHMFHRAVPTWRQDL